MNREIRELLILKVVLDHIGSNDWMDLEVVKNYKRWFLEATNMGSKVLKNGIWSNKKLEKIIPQVLSYYVSQVLLP